MSRDERCRGTPVLQAADAVEGDVDGSSEEQVTPDADVWREHLRNVGEFIKAQRALSQLSQRELARMSDLSNAYMSQIERGLHEPSLSTLRALASSLGIRADELILYAAGLPVRSQASTTEDAIRQDARLTPDQQAALLAVHRSYVQANRPS